MGELLEEGDTPSILAGESEEEPTLLRLPSKRSGERLVEKDRLSVMLQIIGYFFIISSGCVD